MRGIREVLGELGRKEHSFSLARKWGGDFFEKKSVKKLLNNKFYAKSG